MSRGTRPRIYLAGPITGQTYRGATDWRIGVTADLAPYLVGVSPMRGKAFLAKHDGKIEGTSAASYTRENVISSAKGILARDSWDCRTCDAVLMNLLGAKIVSIGSMIEAGMAYDARVPLVVVREPDNIHSHMMLDQASAYTVETLDEGLDLIRMLFHVEGR